MHARCSAWSLAHLGHLVLLAVITSATAPLNNLANKKLGNVAWPWLSPLSMICSNNSEQIQRDYCVLELYVC